MRTQLSIGTHLIKAKHLSIPMQLSITTYATQQYS